MFERLPLSFHKKFALLEFNSQRQSLFVNPFAFRNILKSISSCILELCFINQMKEGDSRGPWSDERFANIVIWWKSAKTLLENWSFFQCLESKVRSLCRIRTEIYGSEGGHKEVLISKWVPILNLISKKARPEFFSRDFSQIWLLLFFVFFSLKLLKKTLGGSINFVKGEWQNIENSREKSTYRTSWLWILTRNTFLTTTIQQNILLASSEKTWWGLWMEF